MSRAIKFQTHTTQLAITGRGLGKTKNSLISSKTLLDNHLMGLELVARESGLYCPAIFQNAAYSMFNHFKLSTSQVATNSVDMYMGYGPVCPDGYGCCYNPLNDEIIFIVSSFSDCQSTCSKRFTAAVESSLKLMGGICSKFHKKRSSSFGQIFFNKNP